MATNKRAAGFPKEKAIKECTGMIISSLKSSREGGSGRRGGEEEDKWSEREEEEEKIGCWVEVD